MTLGGLALAVGILVDEATVTIENINWHLEQGKEVEQAILDGAEQIVTPLSCRCSASASCSCRCSSSPACRAFCSCRWPKRSFRDDLVVHPVAHAGADDGAVSAEEARRARRTRHALPPTRNPLVRFQRGFENRFERFRNGYHELLALSLRHRTCSWSGFSPSWSARSRSRPTSAATSSRRSTTAVSSCMSVPGGNAGRGNRATIRRNRKGAARDHSAEELSTVVDNIGFPISGINMTYNNTGTIGTQDGDIQIS